MAKEYKQKLYYTVKSKNTFKKGCKNNFYLILILIMFFFGIDMYTYRQRTLFSSKNKILELNKNSRYTVILYSIFINNNYIIITIHFCA